MRRLFDCLLLILVLGAWMMSSTVNAVSNSRLTVQVNGLKNQKGKVCFSLFSNEQGFPTQSDRAIASRCVETGQASVSATFEQLAPGRYAVAVLHDANNDGNFNTGFLRNPRIGTGAPKFRDTAILVTGENTMIQIDLKYLL
jgi:uncharacterized protein (DUF2141 family)